MTGVLTGRGNLDTDTVHREDDVKTQGENDHVQAKERGLKQILPSWPSEGTNLADTLILDFQSL